MDSDEKCSFDDTRVILVRHAKSKFNSACRKLEDRGWTKEEYRDLWSNGKYRDWSISETGVKQCKKEAKTIRDVNIHTVFISPLRRTMQTAALLFKDHPNFDKIKFIILPKAKESLEGPDDIPTNIDLTISEFSKDFPSLDATLFNKYEDKYMYFFEDLDESIRAELQPQIKEDESDPIGNNILSRLIFYWMWN